MFVMAGDYVKHNTEFEVVGGYLSPVSDAYRKQGLAPAEHRYVEMKPIDNTMADVHIEWPCVNSR